MAERVMVVCDVCGKQATTTASIRVGSRNLHKDLCDTHVAELTKGARPARRGRPRGTANASKAAASKATAARPRKRAATRRRRKAATRKARSS